MDEDRQRRSSRSSSGGGVGGPFGMVPYGLATVRIVFVGESRVARHDPYMRVQVTDEQKEEFESGMEMVSWARWVGQVVVSCSASRYSAHRRHCPSSGYHIAYLRNLYISMDTCITSFHPPRIHCLLKRSVIHRHSFSACLRSSRRMGRMS